MTTTTTTTTDTDSDTDSDTGTGTGTTTDTDSDTMTEPGASAATMWTQVCALTDLLPDRGVAALVGGVQVALFRLSDGPVLAVGNTDPTTGANVLSRGLVGSRGDRVVVFSPLHKQAFDLVTGDCLDAAGVSVPTYVVEVRDGQVFVGT